MAQWGMKTWGYAHRVDIDANAERIWRALTVSDELGRWCSPGATIQPRAGGLFRASVDRVVELEAHIDVFDAPRRLRLIYLPSDALPQAESALVDDFILDKGSGVTVVRLLGSGMPATKGWEAPFLRMRTAWERALARLKVFAEQESTREGAS
jgi:uncharacterized protein YndB with AHSA1/START domain